MMKRLLDFRLCAVLLLACCSAVCPASERRETPLVRAVKRAKRAVVNIHSEKSAPRMDTLFSSAKSRKINGMGTGIVVDERGYIVTNYHVIHNVESLRVTLVDGSTYDGRIIAYDRKADLAVIKVAPTRELAVMPVGTSADLMLGETVIAVGNAFGYEHTVTSGIISALSRDVEVNDKQAYDDLIQTDASINPGNSGGPLLNLDGEVVGINVAIRAGAQRIGFAIPINEARRIIARLLSVRELNNTWHGIRTRDVKNGDGLRLVVEGTEPGSPAETAGLKPDDVILRAGRTRIVDRVDLERALLERPAGEPVDLRIRRDGEEQSVSLTLAAYENQPQPLAARETVFRANNEEGDPAAKAWRLLGLRVVELTGNERQAVRPRYRGGMRIVGVRDGSPAAASGIRDGDILVGLHVWETGSLANLAYILDHPEFDNFNPVKFYIFRGGETLYGHLRLRLAER